MLTEEELHKIFDWLPYREDWPADRNLFDDGIKACYGRLIGRFKENKIFNLYVFHDGGMSNYLEFLCYPTGQENYSGIGILVFINLCAPIAAYGQTDCTISGKLWARGYIKAEKIGVISLSELKNIENEIKDILNSNAITILDNQFLSKQLPADVTNRIDFALGDRYLDGLFQRAD